MCVLAWDTASMLVAERSSWIGKSLIKLLKFTTKRVLVSELGKGKLGRGGGGRVIPLSVDFLSPIVSVSKLRVAKYLFAPLKMLKVQTKYYLLARKDGLSMKKIEKK